MGIKAADLEKGLGIKSDADLKTYIDNIQKQTDSNGDNTDRIIAAMYDIAGKPLPTDPDHGSQQPLPYGHVVSHDITTPYHGGQQPVILPGHAGPHDVGPPVGGDLPPPPRGGQSPGEFEKSTAQSAERDRVMVQVRDRLDRLLEVTRTDVVGAIREGTHATADVGVAIRSTPRASAFDPPSRR
jgi:hypothetical protein